MRGTDRVRDDHILWVEAMSVLCRVVCNMRVSKWIKAVFQKGLTCQLNLAGDR